jgi:hypothetical protein
MSNRKQSSKKSNAKTKEDKSKWYPGPQLTEKEKKLCRCLLEQHANELERYGHTKTVAYAVCLSSVTHKKETASGMSQRSHLAKMLVQGRCTKELSLSALPTRILYAYAHLRQNTTKGQKFFHWIPAPKVFFHDPEHYRVSLLRATKAYQDYEAKKDRSSSKNISG